jgi:hypothetical protein
MYTETGAPRSDLEKRVFRISTSTSRPRISPGFASGLRYEVCFLSPLLAD